MCYSAKAVANFFIKKSLEDHKPLTHLQLQKMVFFAHAVYFKKYHKPLVVDPIFAWKYGPVIQDLYLELKHYKNAPISGAIASCDITPDGDMYSRIPEINWNDSKMVDFLDDAYKSLSKMKVSRLCAVSHAEGGAWYKTLENNGKNPNDHDVDIPRNLIIPDAVIEACGR